MTTAIRLLPVANTRASLAIDGPASATWNTVIEARDGTIGANGNLITLSAAADGTWVPCVGTLTLTGNATAEVKASLDLDTVTGDLDTIVRAKVAGVEGNDITVTVVGDSAAAAGVTIDEVGTAVTIHFEDGVSTVLDVETAIGTDSDLIEVDTTGTAATVLDAATDECTAEPLVDGATETVTIGTTVYNWRDAATTGAFDVEIGADAEASLNNLIAAINLGAGAGTVYGSATTEHPTVRAFAGAGDTMVVHSRPDVLADDGTLIATTQTMANGTWAATTLADGTDGTNVTFEVVGTAIACHFAGGYSCVEDFEAAILSDSAVYALIRLKTAGTTPLYQLVVTDDDFSATALTGGGATSSGVPSGATVGVSFEGCIDQAVILLRSVAGSGTMTATLRLWGYSPLTAQWYSLGLLNDGAAIGEVDTDKLAHAELVTGLRAFSRLYCEIESLGGTATEIEVVASCVRAEPVSR